MKYLDYFRKSIGSVPVSTTSKTVESILIRLFSAFTELVESQISFLHQSSKLHLVNSAIPLLQYVRGNFISVKFNEPNTYYLLVSMSAIDSDDNWQGFTLTPQNFNFEGDKTQARIINTVLIPAQADSFSEFALVVAYGVSEVITRTVNTTNDEYLEIKSTITWSESITLTVSGLRWRKVDSVSDATTNCFIVTLSEFQRPILVFPKNTPVGEAVVGYQESYTNINTSFRLNNPQLMPGFNALIIVDSFTQFSGMPTVRQLKNIVRLYYENNNWSPSKVVDTVMTINGITKAKFIRLSSKSIQLEINTINGELTGYLGFIFNTLENYLKFSGEELIVSLAARVYFSMEVRIVGVEKRDVATLLAAYINYNDTLRLGDIYEIIESNIEGSSQVLSAQFTPIVYREELPDLVFSITNLNSLQQPVILQLIMVSTTSCYLYEVDGDASYFAGAAKVNGVIQNITLSDDTIIKVSLIGSGEVGKYNLYELTPSLMTVGEVSPTFSFLEGNINVYYN
jgi:hypothetical protein